MECKLEFAPTCGALGNNGWIALGSVEGSLYLNKIDLDEKKMLDGWEFKMKASVRDLIFNEDKSQLFCISRNKSVCSYDVETGKRTRCIASGTSDKPNVLCLLPSTARKCQQFATGDEKGEIRTWDFRSDSPQICIWKEQEEDVNALAMDSKHNLLSASSDGSLAAYDVRKCKLRVKSETMHSELLSLCVTKKYVYAGGIDGVIEVFNHGEYGNLLERVESGFDMGVNQVAELRPGLLLTTSEVSSKLRLLHVMPTKRLGIVASHGESEEGVDKIVLSPNKDVLVSIAGMANSIKAWPLKDIIANVPILRADNIQKRKPVVKEGFFDDLVSTKKARNESDSEEDDDEEVEDEDDSEGDEDSEEEDSEDDDEDSD